MTASSCQLLRGTFIKRLNVLRFQYFRFRQLLFKNKFSPVLSTQPTRKRKQIRTEKIILCFDIKQVDFGFLTQNYTKIFYPGDVRITIVLISREIMHELISCCLSSLRTLLSIITSAKQFGLNVNIIRTQILIMSKS